MGAAAAVSQERPHVDANALLSLARGYVYGDVDEDTFKEALEHAPGSAVQLALEYLEGHGEPDPRPQLPQPRLTKYIPYPPHPGPQTALLLYEGRECLYGGAVGGGKSVGLLMSALQYVDVPGYAALLIRRTFKQLAKPGALIPLSQEWLKGTDAHWDGNNKQWRFPSGAILEFGYLEHAGDEHNYQGAAYQYVAFDELGQFPSADPYKYLFSRMRKADELPVPLRMRASANPGGPGMSWVKGRFIDNTCPPHRIFIRSTLEDNPSLDHNSYDEVLSELTQAQRMRLRQGRWDVEDDGPLWGGENFPIYGARPELLRAELKGHTFVVVDCKGKLRTGRKRRAGESAVSATCYHGVPGKLYTLDEEYGCWGLVDTMRALYRLIYRTQPDAIVVENKALGPEVILNLKSGWEDPDTGHKHPPLSGVIAWNPKGSKEERAERCQTPVLAGDVLVPDPNRYPWVSDHVSELARTPAAPNDRGDTLVMGIEYWLKNKKKRRPKAGEAAAAMAGVARRTPRLRRR